MTIAPPDKASAIPDRFAASPWLRVALLIAALTAMRLVYASVLDLRTDEAYYWTWSKESALSFLDHQLDNHAADFGADEALMGGNDVAFGLEGDFPFRDCRGFGTGGSGLGCIGRRRSSLLFTRSFILVPSLIFSSPGLNRLIRQPAANAQHQHRKAPGDQRAKVARPVGNPRQAQGADAVLELGVFRARHRRSRRRG